MRLARFKKEDLEELIKNTAKHIDKRGTHYTLGQLLRGVGFRGGIPLNEDGQSEEEFRKSGSEGFWWPSDKHTVHEAPPCFELVGDSGVYLMPNCNIPKDKNFITEGLVIYAEGCDPNLNDDYYDNKEYIFGGDDGSVTVPPEWVLDAAEENESLVLNITDEDISVYSEEKNEG